MAVVSPPAVISQEQLFNISNNIGLIGYYLSRSTAGISAIQTGTAFFEDFEDETNVASKQNFTFDGPNNKMVSNIGGVVGQGIGTADGSMVLGGGLAASFNGTKFETSPNSSKSNSINGNIDSYVAKDWGVGNDKIISQVEVWPADTGFGLGAGKTAILKLIGSTSKTGAGATSAPSGTVVELGNISFSSGLQLTQKVITSNDLVTPYRYTWASMQHNGGFATNIFSEVEFTEVITTPRIITSTAIAFTESVSKVDVGLYLMQTDSTAPSDFVFEVSRDGGATFVAGTLTSLGFPIIGVNNVYSGIIDLSETPVGQNIVYRLTNSTLKQYDIIQIHVQKVG